MGNRFTLQIVQFLDAYTPNCAMLGGLIQNQKLITWPPKAQAHFVALAVYVYECTAFSGVYFATFLGGVNKNWHKESHIEWIVIEQGLC